MSAVCAVYEFCDHDLATEIRDRISDKTWTAEARWRAAVDVLSGIAYAHAKGVWHRDVKLENCAVARDGTLKLLDFGLAARADDLVPVLFENRLDRAAAALASETVPFA